MEKRSRRRIRDLVALAAFQGLSQNEIGCARISMMARSTNAPFKGRIQKRKTNHLQIFTFGLQRTEERTSAGAMSVSAQKAALGADVQHYFAGTSAGAPLSLEHQEFRRGLNRSGHAAVGLQEPCNFRERADI